MKKLAIHVAAVAGMALGMASAASAGLVNGGFETLSVPMPAANFIVTPAANVPGWQTSATDGLIEIWQQPGPQLPVTPAYEGTKYAELNATQASILYQDSAPIAAGSVVGWQLAHRGRNGVDTMRLTITDLGANGVAGGGDDTVLFTQNFTDGASAWGFYSGGGIIALGNATRFQFEAISTAGPDLTYGNLLDATDFGVGVGTPVPEPTSLALVGLALAGVGFARRGKKAA